MSQINIVFFCCYCMEFLPEIYSNGKQLVSLNDLKTCETSMLDTVKYFRETQQ